MRCIIGVDTARVDSSDRLVDTLSLKGKPFTLPILKTEMSARL